MKNNIPSHHGGPRPSGSDEGVGGPRRLVCDRASGLMGGLDQSGLGQFRMLEERTREPYCLGSNPDGAAQHQCNMVSLPAKWVQEQIFVELLKRIRMAHTCRLDTPEG